MVFEKKKIRMETLSEYLAEVRQSSGLSLSEVAGKTGIKQIFLESLEQGNFAKLPADVYVCGFLKQLSGMYNLEAESLVIQFKKEKSIYGQMHDKKKNRRGQAEKFFWPNQHNSQNFDSSTGDSVCGDNFGLHCLAGFFPLTACRLWKFLSQKLTRW